jgi:hypothetical protein
MLTTEEQVDIEYHLGWVLKQQVLLANGNIVEHQLVSLLRSLVRETEPKHEFRIREALCELQMCQDEKKALRGKAGIVQAGEVKLDVERGLRTLDEEYKGWANKLADIYGGHKNMYSLFHEQIGNGASLRESF